MADEPEHIVELQFAAVVKDYPGLSLRKNGDGSFTISGEFAFNAGFNGETISDRFALEVHVPADYPLSIPVCKEVGGRIPPSFHTNPDGTLCLNVPVELRKLFRTEGTLYDFMKESVIPFLYGFCYYRKHGEMPYGEWSHGGKGLVEYYKTVFNVAEDILVIGLLRILADNDFQRQMLCPCGSKLKLRRCHGIQLRETSAFQSQGEFMYEYQMVLQHLYTEKKRIPDEFLSKALTKYGRGAKNGA